MIDLTSLTMIAAVLLGLVVGDAALFGNTLVLNISVPPKLTEVGFTEAAAQNMFFAEAGHITHVVSAFPTPELRLNSQPTVLTALAKPLGLEGVVGSWATAPGISRLSVDGAIVVHPNDPALDLHMLVLQPGEEPIELKLTEADGDAAALMRRAADVALEEISTYRVALANYARGISGDAAALAQCRDVVARDLAKPWNPGQASEQAMEHNLLALLATLDGNLEAAAQEAARGASIRTVAPQARAILNLNSAFIAVARKDPARARSFYEQAEQTTASLTVPDIGPRIMLIHAVVLWANGDLVGAEQILRQVVAIRPDDEGAHTYLGRLLVAKGDSVGAAVEQAAAATGRYYDPHIMDLVQSVVWVDPTNGGVRRRT